MNPSLGALWRPAVYFAAFRERDSRNWKLLKGLTFYFAPLARGDEEDTLLTLKGSEKWGEGGGRHAVCRMSLIELFFI